MARTARPQVLMRRRLNSAEGGGNVDSFLGAFADDLVPADELC